MINLGDVAIVGSEGYISQFIIKALKNCNHDQNIIKIDKIKREDIFYLDLEEPDKFDFNILDNIEYLVFTAAISGPDACAKEFEKCWKINVIGTSYVIREALKRKCKVLFFSSDAVYGDIPGCVYYELSKTQALTPYGKMKKAVEDAFKAEQNFKCIRLSYVVSAKDRFISYCLACITKHETAEIFHPFYRNCTTISDVVKVVIWLRSNWDKLDSYCLNVTGNELVSRVRMADELNRIYCDKLNYTIVTPSIEFYVNRPAITQMESLYLYNLGILEESSFTKKIQKEMENVIL